MNCWIAGVHLDRLELELDARVAAATAEVDVADDLRPLELRQRGRLPHGRILEAPGLLPGVDVLEQILLEEAVEHTARAEQAREVLGRDVQVAVANERIASGGRLDAEVGDLGPQLAVDALALSAGAFPASRPPRQTAASSGAARAGWRPRRPACSSQCSAAAAARSRAPPRRPRATDRPRRAAAPAHRSAAAPGRAGAPLTKRRMSSNWSSTSDFSSIPVGVPVMLWRALPARSCALPAKPPRAPPISGGTESVVSRSIAFIKGFSGVSGPTGRG